MVNSAFNLLTATHDLAFERGDPSFEFGDRQRVEILAHQLCEQVAGAGQRVVQVHVQQR